MGVSLERRASALLATLQVQAHCSLHLSFRDWRYSLTRPADDDDWPPARPAEIIHEIRPNERPAGSLTEQN